VNMPTSNYFDTLLAQLLNSGAFGPTERSGAASIASEAEDAMLRRQLGSKRKTERGQGGPPGNYSLGKFPGMEHQIWAQESGFLPKGYSWRSMLDESPQERQMRERQQQQWAGYQRQLLGMAPGGRRF
jgi:hypothetical protein